MLGVAVSDAAAVHPSYLDKRRIYLVWNVMVIQVVYAFQLIKNKVFEFYDIVECSMNQAE